jgi:hypothetical protein
MITSFQLLTIENWNTNLFYLMKSSLNPFITCIYVISWIFMGNYILLNLFLAILLDGFTSDEVNQPEVDDNAIIPLDPMKDESDAYF